MTKPGSKTAEAIQVAIDAAKTAGREDVVKRLVEIAKLLPAPLDGVEAD